MGTAKIFQKLNVQHPAKVPKVLRDSEVDRTTELSRYTKAPHQAKPHYQTYQQRSWQGQEQQRRYNPIGKGAMLDSPCPICAFFGHSSEYHPKPNSLLGEVLHAILAGIRPVEVARVLDQDAVQINRAARLLRLKGSIPGRVGKRGRPKRLA